MIWRATSAERGPRRAPLAGLAGLAALAGACGKDASPAAGAAGGAAGASRGGLGGAGATGGASATGGTGGDTPDASCPEPERPPEVPPGWAPYPGLPCRCDLWMAPSEAHLSPAPAWRERRTGLLEMDVYWAAGEMRFVGGRNHGDSWRGRRLLSLYRALPGVSWKKYDDIRVFDVDARQSLLQVIRPTSHRSECGAFVHDVHQGVALMTLWEVQRSGTVTAEDTYIAAGAVEVPGAPLPIVVTLRDTWPADKFQVSALQAMWTHDAISFTVHSFTSGTTVPGAFQPRMYVETEALHDDVGLFGGRASPSSRTVVMARSELQPDGHVVAPSTDAGEAESPGTDGEWVVWTEARGWDGQRWADVALYKARYDRDPRALVGERVRGLPLDVAWRRTPWDVGGGHAAMSYRLGPEATPPLRVLVVRLVDGVLSTLEPETDRGLSVPYLDAEEVGLEEGVRYPNSEGLSGYYAWTILRQKLSALGPGEPP